MRTDVCIYGGSAAGMMAAAGVLRAGCSVLVVEPGRHLGAGLTSGVCHVTGANKAGVQGFCKDLMHRIARTYDQPWVDRWEPCVAEAAFLDLARDSNITVLFCHRLRQVKKVDARIERLLVDRVLTGAFNEPLPVDSEEEQAEICAKVYIDCSAEGDLMAAAGVAHQVLPSRLAFHACLTTNPVNRRAIDLAVPELGMMLDELPDLSVQFTLLANAKAQLDIPPAIADRIWGHTAGYLMATPAGRGELWKSAIGRLAATLAYLAKHPHVPEALRKEMARWSPCGDEFHDTQGWPHGGEIVGGRRLEMAMPASMQPIAIDLAGQPITIGAMLPASSACQNLLVPVCSAQARGDDLSRMALAESAASVAALACEAEKGVQSVPYSDILAALRDAGIHL